MSSVEFHCILAYFLHFFFIFFIFYIYLGYRELVQHRWRAVRSHASGGGTLARCHLLLPWAGCTLLAGTSCYCVWCESFWQKLTMPPKWDPVSLVATHFNLKIMESVCSGRLALMLWIATVGHLFGLTALKPNANILSIWPLSSSECSGLVQFIEECETLLHISEI